MHSQFELFMLPPSRNPWPLCAHSSPSSLQIAFLTAARTILLMKDAYVNFLLSVIQGFLVPSLLWAMRSHSVSFCSYFICSDNMNWLHLCARPITEPLCLSLLKVPYCETSFLPYPKSYHPSSYLKFETHCFTLFRSFSCFILSLAYMSVTQHSILSISRL